jgi:glutamate N-acetyltransferase/amino-acid N-acetyltransferase
MAQVHLLTPRGFRGAAVYAGIKTRNTPDVGLLLCHTQGPATAAAVFTTNKVCAAPVKVGREHVAGGKLRAVVVNAGCANACTGRQGEKDARRMCRIAGEVVEADPSLILPSSTGIIGHLLPMDKLEIGIRDCGLYLGDSLEHALLFADAILTTDLKRKSAAAQLKIGRQTVTVAGVCKGSGMIGPRMTLAKPGSARPARGMHATMLGYITTDAAVPAPLLRQLLGACTETSFNAVTVDDHTSTNDTVVVMASGGSNAAVRAGTAEARKFAAALQEVCQSLAYQIAADGEGATKVVVVKVKGAASQPDARTMARAIANSPLVKCAMHGNDPNWGRIVSAAGLTPAAFNPDRATLKIQGTVVFRNGQPVVFDAEAVSELLKSPEVAVDLSSRHGKGDATVWTCDLSKEYVTINADYHT